MTTGNHPLYEELEKRLAKFFNAPAAVLVSSGYMTNLALAQALAGEFSHALIDERAHACLFDAAHFFRCPVKPFRHRDPSDAIRALSACGRRPRPILLTDGLFSHDGSIAPLAAYRKVLPKSGTILVDDAHAAAVLGHKGQGSLEYLGLDRTRIIQTVTLSKGFGAYGGAILGSRELRDKIRTRSQAFIGNTPLPLPLVGAALEAIHVFQGDPTLRERLDGHTRRVKAVLAEIGHTLPSTPAPVIPVIPSSPREAAALKASLLKAGIYPPLIQYPGGPTDGYFRFALSSEHTERQVDALLQVLLEHLQPKSCGRRPRKA